MCSLLIGRHLGLVVWDGQGLLDRSRGVGHDFAFRAWELMPGCEIKHETLRRILMLVKVNYRRII
ncbi:MAG TPA: hypothetical protein DDZ81_01350 [Acetobacteraceae bacterium]|nr:hypothetical protein [Acetobacteraceae bacterium]